MKNNFAKGCIVMLLSIMVFIGQANAEAASFTAKVMQTFADTSIEGELFVKGNVYLFETTETGEDISVIVNRESGMTKVLYNSREIMTEIPDTSTKSLSIDPFQSFWYLLKKHSSREKGPTVVNDYKSMEVEIYGKDTVYMIAWVSKRLDWPVKIESKVGPPMEVNLKKIVEKPLGECLFNIPSNYKFMPYSEMKKGMKLEMKKEGTKVKEKTEM
jgi:hypothetical protein